MRKPNLGSADVIVTVHGTNPGLASVGTTSENGSDQTQIELRLAMLTS